MSITQTFTVTMTGSLGAKKYVIDGVQQPKINLVRGGLYIFDVSDSSNTDQALRFSTTENGTHNGGSIYTTGISQNLGGGNPGAQVQFQVASDAPSSLHYFDVNAGTNAGGEISTLLGSTYGTPPWNVNSWGSDEIIVSLTGVEATTSLGSVDAFPFQGWGRQEYGNSGWGVEYSVAPSGLSASTSLGSVTAEQFVTVELTGISATTSLGSISINTLIIPTGLEATVSLGQTEESNQRGWGRLGWGIADWGEGRDETVSVTGVEATASTGEVVCESKYLLDVGPAFKMTGQVGSVSIGIGVEMTGVEATFATPTMGYAGTLVGWGRDGWGDNSWGESPNQVITLVGRAATTSVGSPTLEFAYELSGQEATTNVGSVGFVISPTVSLDGQSATTSVGSPTLEFAYELSGQEATGAVGSLTLEFAYELDGQSATSSVGELDISSGQLINVSGISATSSVGSISPADVVGLSGVSATVSVGSITPADVVQGLITDQITSNVGVIGIQAYADIDTGSNTSYTSVATGSNSSYSNVATGSNTSYSDVA